MAMPALQQFQARWPRRRVVILAKPPLLPLWGMHGAVHAVLPLDEGLAGVWRATRMVRARHAAIAYVLPNSIRSALVPFGAGVRARIGQRGQRWPGMLTHLVTGSPDAKREHQAWEYMRILGVDDVATLERPRLDIPSEVVTETDARLDVVPGVPLIGVLPGAAYGPSKRWPSRNFAEVARMLRTQLRGRVVLLGGKAEVPVCAEVEAALGGAVLNLAGATSLPELAAGLARCSVVLCNDSGGMHVSAAVGTPVVAVYGITDPAATGPLGPGHRIVFTPGVRQSRNLARDSDAAREALAAITPARVVAEALAALQERGP